MTLLEVIARWQEEAVGIRPPLVDNRVGAVGGMPGPAFFPEGRGIANHASKIVPHRLSWR
jgi:hypothetical protein